MCGIAGELQFIPGDASFSKMEQVNLKQKNRGPDSSGIYQFGQVTLGHRRLKIFDLTDRAAQPMIDTTLGLALVFNGAIYNFRELRSELISLGYSFTSDSDTEVLLKAYHAWKENCISRLRGMFAFAIWDRETDSLVLARDRLGIKPLYYSNTQTEFKFASTLPALLEFGNINTSINPTALHYYLMFHAVPEPFTILSGVQKLSPGSVLTVQSNGKIKQHIYWTLEINEQYANHEKNIEQWLDTTHHVLSDATKRQLAADTPVGVLLSGGLDSSLLTAFASKYSKSKIQTFSIGFENAKDEKGDEFYYSNLVATHCNTEHHQFFISNKNLKDKLSDCITAMSEPMPSHDNIGFYLLAHEVAKNVKVVLSGQGADEIFAGYSWFQKAAGIHATSKEMPFLLAQLISDRSYTEYKSIVTQDNCTENKSFSFLKEICSNNQSSALLDHLFFYETTFALANGPLCRVDNMTMAPSLEARVPFLDEELINLASKIPHKYKIANGGKYVLKQLGKKVLPKEVVERQKGYFPVPALRHIQGPMLELMNDILSPQRLKQRGIFNSKTIQAMLSRPEEHFTPLGASKLWQVAMLEYWLQLQGL